MKSSISVNLLHVYIKLINYKPGYYTTTHIYNSLNKYYQHYLYTLSTRNVSFNNKESDLQ